MSRMLTGALLLGFAVFAARAEEKPAKPNILLIVVESLRADHVGCYGYSRPTTPVLDRIAGEGARFQQAIPAASWTIPTVMTMFTSLPTDIHNTRSYKHRLADGLTTLAAELRKGGYHTAGFTSNPSTHGAFGFARGFDVYDDFTILMDVDVGALTANGLPADSSEKVTSPQVNQLALRWLDQRWDRKRPFFLHLFYFDPHYNYLPPSPYDAMFTDPKYDGSQDGRGISELGKAKLLDNDKAQIIGLYDGEIRYTDEHLGMLVEELKKRGLYDKTLVVVVGDHGEEFWDHGRTAHGHTLYDELVRVPLIVRCPSLVPAGMVVTQQVGHIDIMPTLLDMAGAPVPSQCLGRSVKPLLTKKDATIVPRAVALETELEGPLRALRTPTRKVIENLKTKTVEMYDLAADPKERDNLAGTEQAKGFDALLKDLRAWDQLVLPPSALAKEPEKPAELNPELLRQLKSLGYVR